MKEYPAGFYKGKQWKKVSRAYMQSRSYVCERCGGAASICHHKTYITPGNINDTSITLDPANLECLCQDCHNQEHKARHSRVLFDCNGNVTGVEDGKEIEEYRQAARAVEAMGYQEGKA